MEEEGPRFFGEAFAPYIKILNNEYYRVHNHVMRHTEGLHELRETNNSLLTTKQNETTKTLTIMAFIMLPLSFIADLFAMDTKFMPIIGTPGDFYIILTLMILIAASTFGFFKYKHWL